MLAIENATFDPVLLSLEENAFLVEHAGKAPAVVKRLPVPPGVNPKAVIPVIEELYALGEVEKADGATWAGIEAVKDRCRTYLAEKAKWAAMKARGGERFPAHPSMATWDSRGNPHMGGVGSDAGRIRTYFDEAGQRQPFAVSLQGEAPTFDVPWLPKAKTYSEISVDDERGVLTCPICGHAETYSPDSQSQRGLANTRMAKHLLGAKKEIEAHKQLHVKVYA